MKMNLSFIEPHIPYEYIEEDSLRMSLMRRFAEAQDMRVVRALEEEMRDRFGPPPQEARDFVTIAALRVACAAAKIDRIDEANGRAVFRRIGSHDIAKVVDLKGKSAAAKLSELIRACTSSRRA